MAASSATIDVVLPVHNEGASIADTLREFHRVVMLEGGQPIRFVVCEEGSSDDTVRVLQKIATELPLKLISHPVRKGYSRAVIDGFRGTTSDWVGFIDSDGQCDPADMLRLAALRERADLIMGWRNPRSDPWIRKAMSRAFKAVYRLFFRVPVRDPSCPYLLINRAGLAKILSGNVGILKQGFWWEFLARAVRAKLRIVETPVRHRARASGVTQIYRPAKLPRIAAEHLLGLFRLRRELDACRKPAWRNALAWCWLALGALAALWSHAAMATSAFGVNFFDESLRLLQVIYAAHGLTPYADYGFLYPPGFAWFYGKLLRLREPESVVAVIAVVNLLLVVACAGQLMRLAPNRRRLLGGTVLLMLGGVIPVASKLSGQEPATLILLPIAMLLLVEVMTRGLSTARVAALVGVATIGTLIRWDWILTASVLEAGGAAAVWLAAGMIRLEPGQSAQVRQAAASLWWAALAALAGVSLAVAVLAGHALAIGTWAETRLFVFDLPLLILPYRRLPLPLPLDKNLQWFVDITAMTLIALAALLARVKTRAGLVYFLEGGTLLVPCVALLPYTFTRANFFHFLPLSVLLIVTCLTAFTLWRSPAARWALLIALGITATPTLSIALHYVVSTGVVPQADIHLQKTRELTAGCTDLFPTDARSLFVGQVSYERFLANLPVLYLSRPDLRPATPFISDEPGVQNSCALGSRIAADLTRARRPLVVVLDTKPWNPEDNLTRVMTSCGKIEAAIATLPAVELGTCRVHDRIFRVTVVR
jgi:glycosyltransferase involved in cell wall biosynthesis